MPITTITHEPWCEEHITEAGWNTCNSEAIDFGPIDRESFAIGSLWLSQDERQKNQLMLAGSYGIHSFRIDVEVARAFLAAASDDAQVLIAVLATALERVDTEVTK